MGLDRAKSLLRGPRRADVPRRHRPPGAGPPPRPRRPAADHVPALVPHVRRQPAGALRPTRTSPPAPVPLEVRQNRVPKLRADDLTPGALAGRPVARVVPARTRRPVPRAPRHRPDRHAPRRPGSPRSSCPTPTTSARSPTRRRRRGSPRAAHRSPSRRCARTASDRKGGHFAGRRRDGRIVLRETAQTLPEDLAPLADLTRHRFMSTNNLWFDLAAMRCDAARPAGRARPAADQEPQDRRSGRPRQPAVVQLETAMGAAIELFDGAQTVEVDRERFIPVKTTNDLLVLRSDCYGLDDGYRLQQAVRELPFVDLDPIYTTIESSSVGSPTGCRAWSTPTSLSCMATGRSARTSASWATVELGPEGGTVPAGRCWEVAGDGSDGRRSSAGARQPDRRSHRLHGWALPADRHRPVGRGGRSARPDHRRVALHSVAEASSVESRSTEPTRRRAPHGVATSPPWPGGSARRTASSAPSGPTCPIGAGLSSSAALEVAMALALGADRSDPLALADAVSRCRARSAGRADGPARPAGVDPRRRRSRPAPRLRHEHRHADAAAAGRRGRHRRVRRRAAPARGDRVRRTGRRVRTHRAADRSAAVGLARRRRSGSPTRRCGDGPATSSARTRASASSPPRWPPATSCRAGGSWTPAIAACATTTSRRAPPSTGCAPSWDVVPGVFGARITGGGWGGAVVALVRPGTDLDGGWPVRAVDGASVDAVT